MVVEIFTSEGERYKEETCNKIQNFGRQTVG